MENRDKPNRNKDSVDADPVSSNTVGHNKRVYIYNDNVGTGRNFLI